MQAVQVSTNQNRAEIPWRAYVALAIGIVCIALSAIWVKWAAVPGPVSAFYRMLIPAVILVPWWFAKRPKHLPKQATRLSLLGGVFFAFDLALWNTAILLTSAANSTLFANNAPLWVGLGAWLIFRERLPQRFWWGMAIALIGVVVIMGENLQQLTISRGDLLAISAGGFYAAYLLTTQRARAELDTLTFMTLGIVVSVVILGLLCLIGGFSIIGFSAKTWWSLLGLGLVSHLGGWLAINYALGHIKAATASVSLLGQPVLTALISIPLLNEPLQIFQIIGGSLVIGGIWLVNTQKEAADNKV
ncbi:DMT family transporter [Herpetosiphon giganteus]|uniref:DMT family transporter n=1 Tax=Herpetosiphon giganteus TaxID=2029754 RepID=UPI00195C7141|nr:DMT family transporter [Herpetosiphon giganteus]MBM7841412.1 drug/metabolite transporter (DMT)-like permease [Herpetosiphon giganteus]